MRVWDGISNSPILFARAGYSLGALSAIFISKSFVKFNPLLIDRNQTIVTDNSSIIESDDIKIKIPYSIVGMISLVVGFTFVASQYFDSKHKIHLKHKNSLREHKSSRFKVYTSVLDRISFLVFNDKSYEKRVFRSKIILAFLLLVVTISIGGFTVILSNFMMTYQTKGPAKLAVKTFFQIQIVYWIFMTVGRLLAGNFAFKLNTLVYVFFLISINFVCILIYSIPQFNLIPKFYWFISVPLAIVVGPVVPCTIMLGKHVMKQLSPFLISVYSIGVAIGSILGQLMTGFLLDELKPKPNWLIYNDATSVYVIPFLVLFSVTICLTFYIILIIVKRRLNF